MRAINRFDISLALLALSASSLVSADIHHRGSHGPGVARREAHAAQYLKMHGLDRRQRTAAGTRSTEAASSDALPTASSSVLTDSPTSTTVPTTFATSLSTSASATDASSVPSSTITSAPSSSSSASSSSSSSSISTSLIDVPGVANARCAIAYAGASSVTGTGTLPKPTTFVQKARTQGNVLDGNPFRIVGPNIYWLCQDENVGVVGAPTDKGRVREALAAAVAMGANTIRLISCGVSVGNQYSIEPVLGQFTNWDIHDYVIYAAGQYGLRVILPLTDDYYHGGKYTFLRWRGLDTGNFGSLFYTDATVISDFKQYIIQLLTHVNTYNGKRWADDPTILAWETGNELGGYIGNDGYPPVAWTSQIASLIKQYDPNHIVIDGTDGFYNYTTKATPGGLSTRVATNIMSDHGYPRNNALINSEIPLATAAQKGFLIGEYDWTNSFGGDTLADYLALIESTSYMGDMIWNLMGHDAQCCSYVAHNDGYSMYYPNGNDRGLQGNILLVVQHWYRLTGRTVPRAMVGVTCPQPVF